MSTTPSSPLCSLSTAAKYLDVSPRTLRLLRQRGEIPTVYVRPGCPRIHVDDLDALIEARTQRPRPQPRNKRRRS